jgi:hypothetical protein
MAGDGGGPVSGLRSPLAATAATTAATTATHTHLNLSFCSLSVPRSMWSFTRPGVPTTMSTP